MKFQLDDIAIGSILAVGVWMAYKKFTAKPKATAVQQVIQGAVMGGAGGIQCIKAPCSPVFPQTNPQLSPTKIEVHYLAKCPTGFIESTGSELPSSRSSKICYKAFLGY